MIIILYSFLAHCAALGREIIPNIKEKLALSQLVPQKGDQYAIIDAFTFFTIYIYTQHDGMITFKHVMVSVSVLVIFACNN